MAVESVMVKYAPGLRPDTTDNPRCPKFLGPAKGSVASLPELARHFSSRAFRAPPWMLTRSGFSLSLSQGGHLSPFYRRLTIPSINRTRAVLVSGSCKLCPRRRYIGGRPPLSAQPPQT